MSFIKKWIYCSCCDCVAAICIECGNNACNGNYGKDGDCETCPKVYEEQEYAYRNDLAPNKEDLKVKYIDEWIEAIRKDRDDWD